MATAADTTGLGASQRPDINRLGLRISNIPSSMTPGSLTKLLNSLATSRDRATKEAKRHRQDNIHALSLAPSPLSIDSRRFQVATVTFRRIPDELEPCRSHPSWVTITLGEGEMKFDAIVDSHFEGFTPLNNSSDPSIEYVAHSHVNCQSLHVFVSG